MRTSVMVLLQTLMIVELGGERGGRKRTNSCTGQNLHRAKNREFLYY